jgi:hypothetical protein
MRSVRLSLSDDHDDREGTARHHTHTNLVHIARQSHIGAMRPLTASVLVTMATVALSSESRAQHAPCTVPPSTRSVPGHIYATLTPVGDDPTPRDYGALLLQSMGQGFHTTAAPALVEYDVTDSIATAAAYASAQFTVTDVGQVRKVKLIASSLSPSFDQSLLATIYAADSNGLVPPFPDGMHGHRAFELRLESGTAPDSASTELVAQWATTSIAVWDSARATRNVRTPSIALGAHLERTIPGFMVFSSAVGPDGRIVDATAEFRPGSAPPGGAPVRADLPVHFPGAGMRFQPATIGRCAVPALTVQEFRMVITQPGGAHH